MKAGDIVNYPMRENNWIELDVTVVNEQGWIFLKNHKTGFAVRLMPDELDARIELYKALEQPKEVTETKKEKRARLIQLATDKGLEFPKNIPMKKLEQLLN